jgi:thioredoxin-dependent peroxiredoxin
MIFLFCACASADVKNTSSAPGRTAVDFTLPDQDGKLWTLRDTLKNYQAVVLAFYPKDDTGVWIRQFVEFQQNIAKYESRKIKILGLSRDSAESHRNFIAKHGLNNMTLLVDDGGKIAKLYDADHWLLPLSKRVYLIIDQKMNVIYRKDMGFALLPDQTETLIGEIERNVK